MSNLLTSTQKSEDEKLVRHTKQHFPRGLFITALLTIIVWGVATARPFLAPLCIAALLGFLIAPLIRFLTRMHFPEWLAVTTSTVVLIIPFPMASYIIIRQGQALIRDFPLIINSLKRFAESVSNSKIGQSLHIATYLNPDALVEKLSAIAGQSLQIVVTGLSAALNAGSEIALILLFTVLMVASRMHLRRSFENLLSRSESIRGGDMLDALATLIERFLLARLIITIIVAAYATLVLMIFSLPYSFLMGTFIGIMTLLPAVGFVLSIIPPIVVSVAEGQAIGSTLLILVALLIISIIEGNILTPKLVGKRLNINALSSFVGIFAGGLLWGISGMLLSIPFLGIIRIIFSAVPSLQPWGDLLAEKEDKLLARKLMRKTGKS